MKTGAQGAALTQGSTRYRASHSSVALLQARMEASLKGGVGSLPSPGPCQSATLA